VAPEVLADKGYDGKKADVWSIGVILYVLLAGFLPFDETTIVALFAKIQAADFTYPSWFSPEVRTLLDRILVADPAKRITLTEVAQDPWCLKPSQGLPGGSVTDHSAVPKLGSAHSFRTGAAGGTSTVPRLPTEAEIKDGMADAVQEDVPVVTEKDHSEAKNSGDKALNAFELINQTGGFQLERLAYGQSRVDKTVKRVFHFSSACTPPSRLMDTVISALQEGGCEVSVSNDNPLKVRATRHVSSKGMIGVTIEVFSLTDTLCLLEVRRGKGDIMEFHEFIRDFIGNKISSSINYTD
jgi:serine/threonine protein kinase